MEDRIEPAPLEPKLDDQAKMDEHEHEAAPFYSLPDVIVAKIFLKVVEGAASNETSKYREGLKNVSSFAQTCKFFSEIATDERLWARLFRRRFGKGVENGAPIDGFTNAPIAPPPPVRRMPTLPEIGGILWKQLSELHASRPENRQANQDIENNNGIDNELSKHTVTRSPAVPCVAVPKIAKPLPVKRRINASAKWRDAYRMNHEGVAQRDRIEEEERIEHNKCSNVSGRFVRDRVCCGSPQYYTYFTVSACLGLIPLLLSLLIPFKLDGFLGQGVSWSVVLLPMWLGTFLIQFGIICIRLEDSTFFDDFEIDWEESFDDMYIDVGVFCVQLIFLIFPIFMVLQGDMQVQWSYGVTFIPVYVIMGALQCAVCVALYSWASDELYDWDDVQDNPLLLLILVCTFLGALSLIPFTILLPLWLDGNLSATFFHVCIPLWISVVLLAIPGKIVMGMYTFVPWVLLVFFPFGVFPALVALKVEKIVEMSWSIACIPVYVPILLVTIAVFIMVIFRLGPLFHNDEEDDAYWNNDVEDFPMDHQQDWDAMLAAEDSDGEDLMYE